MKFKSLWILALLALVLVAADKADDKAAAGQKKLQGTWQFVKGMQGDTDKNDDMKTCQLTIDGDKFVVKADSQSVIEGTFKIDAAHTPPQIDWTVLKDANDNQHVGQKSLAIYQLDGDKLKLCAADAGQPKRPTEFVTKGTDFMLFDFERVKK
jgi:uncharacterized protein (TIGR03067 family)